MKPQLSIFFARSKTFLSSNFLKNSFLTLASSVMLGQPVFANNPETFYFRREYQESGYRLEGTFTALDSDLDNIISPPEVSNFAAFLTDVNDGWKESIDLGAEKNIIDFHYNLDSYLSGSSDLKFKIDTIKTNNYPDFFAPLKAEEEVVFPQDSSWKVDFTEDTDFFRISDYIIVGMDKNRTGIVTFIDDGNNGGNGATTPEASNLGGLALIAIGLFGLKKRSK
jgi:hypothetical protein